MPSQDPDHLKSIGILGSIFVIAALGGVAALLRSGKRLSHRAVLSALLNSGLIGLIIGLCWWQTYQETNLYALIGISALAGLGGNTTIGLIYVYVQKKCGVKLPDDETP